jgi:16S rRNA (guanine527-N7)-methyltransferase
MKTSRIAELLAPFLQEVTDQQPAVNDDLYKDISTYIDILLHWNTRINLTAIRNEDEIVTRHFGESLFAARHLFPRPSFSLKRAGSANDQPLTTNDCAAARVADLGSGAGFPGVPIKLWQPQIDLTLIESTYKKATFLRELIRALTLTNIDIQNVRAEKLVPAGFNVVTVRAVEHFTEILPVAANLLAPSGRLALLIGSHQLNQARATLPGLSWQPAIALPQSQSRHLLIGSPEPRQ